MRKAYRAFIVSRVLVKLCRRFTVPAHDLERADRALMPLRVAPGLGHRSQSSGEASWSWNLTLCDRADQLVSLLSIFVFSPEGFQQLRA